MNIKAGKYLITGIAGTGKTSVVGELVQRGFKAYSTDEMPHVTCFEDRISGARFAKLEKEEGRPRDFSKYAWNWQAEGLQELLASSQTVFIGASVMNQYDFIDSFNKLFVLRIDEATLHHRLAARTNNEYGKHPDELMRILSLHEVRERAALEHGAIPIQSAQPLDKVADDILSHLITP